MRRSVLGVIAYLLVIVGGINWGLVGFFDYNLVDEIFGLGSGISRTIYALVGLAALYVLYDFLRSDRRERPVA